VRDRSAFHSLLLTSWYLDPEPSQSQEFPSLCSQLALPTGREAQAGRGYRVGGIESPYSPPPTPPPLGGRGKLNFLGLAFPR